MTDDKCIYLRRYFTLISIVTDLPAHSFTAEVKSVTAGVRSTVFGPLFAWKLRLSPIKKLVQQMDYHLLVNTI